MNPVTAVVILGSVAQAPEVLRIIAADRRDKRARAAAKAAGK